MKEDGVSASFFSVVARQRNIKNSSKIKFMMKNLKSKD